MTSSVLYRGIKLVEHAMKIVESRAREANTNIDQIEQNAIWIYAGKNGCNIHCEKDIRGITK